MIDIITVVFREELPVLQVQAASMAQYLCHNDVSKIWVVVNDSDSVFQQIDPLWWGALADRVTVCQVNTHSYNNGWLTQQLCKLTAAASATTDWSMVVDAKTVFVRDWQLSDVLTEQGMAVGTLPIFPVFAESQQRIQKLFGIEFDQQLGPGGVPFFFHTATVTDMIQHIENLVDQEFGLWFLEQGRITEFMLYSGYVLYRHEKFAPLYSDKRAFDVENVCHSETQRFDQKFKNMQQHNLLTVSVHREAWAKLSEIQKQQYRDFLIDRKILEAKIL